MGTAAGVDATVRRPVWCGQRASGGSPADGNAKRTPPGCAHCAESRSIDEVALRSRWPPIPSHRAGRDRRSTASTAARLGARSANLGQTAHYSQAIAHFVDRRSRTDRVGPVGGPTERRRSPHRSPGLRGVAGCPAPTAIAVESGREQGWIGEDHGWRDITDPCRNNGGLVHVALAAALVGENGDRVKAVECAVRLWL
jgi:hypothetical protein